MKKPTTLIKNWYQIIESAREQGCTGYPAGKSGLFDIRYPAGY
jgi:hypothetical protein